MVVVSVHFPYTNHNFAACDGPIISIIVFTTAYLAQKGHEQPSDFQNLQFLLALASILSFLGTKWANNSFKEGLYVRRRRENFSIGLKHALISNKRATNPFKEG